MRVIRVKKSEVEDTINDYNDLGFKVKSSTNAQTILEKKQYGSLKWHIILLITLGFGNIFYLIYSYFNPEKVIIKLRN